MSSVESQYQLRASILYHQSHVIQFPCARKNILSIEMNTGLSMEFDKIHLKDAIVTWPDMQRKVTSSFHGILPRAFCQLTIKFTIQAVAE